jgi:hypothetical protein
MKLSDERLDRTVRFGCGAALGFFVSFLGVLSSGYEFLESFLIAIGIAIALGVLSAIFGDRFLERLINWLSW